MIDWYTLLQLKKVDEVLLLPATEQIAGVVHPAVAQKDVWVLPAVVQTVVLVSNFLNNKFVKHYVIHNHFFFGTKSIFHHQTVPSFKKVFHFFSMFQKYL